jgi:23S rRNA pseudouridine2605 synthase
MPKKSRKNPELNATENPESIVTGNPEPKATENPEPKAAQKPARKARKKAAGKALAAPDSALADAPGSAQAQLEFSAGSAAGTGPDQVAEARAQAESEAKAAAADTFEQAFDERLPSETSDLLDIVLDAPAREVSDTEAAEARDSAAGIIGDLVRDFEEEPESDAGDRPPAKLERLQKILSRAGIASRRHAEEMIAEGRVQVNGKVITELGSKADAGRDHIRVDGKLLQGAERLRYFVLNKPRGYVTTVSDPEGRPTVMQFFTKMGERLYPVGRLDYLSEGLLLVTNDGDLANKLTKAATGVEKTYLVKVSGQPSQEELDLLREGVAIDRTRPGEGRVQTAPASIRQVRQGDNPWYEVVLVEGRNRELRKMFEEIGHFVEKIRRVGYGPLVLDQEPGQFRELAPEELARLRQAAEGKWRRPKAKAPGRRDLVEAGDLPTVMPKPTRPRPAFEGRDTGAGGTRPYLPKRPFGPSGDQEQARPFRSPRAPGRDFGPAGGRAAAAGKTFGARKPAAGGFVPRTGDSGVKGPAKLGTGRPAWKNEDRGARPPARFSSGVRGEDRRPGYRGGQTASRPAPGRQGPSGGDRSATGRIGGGRAFGARPAWDKREGGNRPRLDQGGSGTRAGSRPGFGAPRSAPSRPHQPGSADSQGDRPRFERTGATRPAQGYSRTGQRPSSPSRPPRGEAKARPFTASTGKPRAEGARPGARPGKNSARPYAGSKPHPEGRSGARPAGKSSWKAKPNYGGTDRPASGAGKRPASNDRRTGGRSGPRPGANRPGGRSGKRH